MIFGCGKHKKNQKKIIRQNELSKLRETVSFSENEIIELRRRFQSMLGPNEMGLTKDNFRKNMGLLGLDQGNFLSDRIFELIDADQNGKIELQEYLYYLDVLINGNQEQKIELTFNMIDIRRKSYFTFEEFSQLIYSILNAWNNISGRQFDIQSSEKLQERIRLAFAKFDIRNTGNIYLQDFREAVLREPNLMEIFDYFNKEIQDSMNPLWALHPQLKTLKDELEKIEVKLTTISNIARNTEADDERGMTMSVQSTKEMFAIEQKMMQYKQNIPFKNLENIKNTFYIEILKEERDKLQPSRMNSYTPMNSTKKNWLKSVNSGQMLRKSSGVAEPDRTSWFFRNLETETPHLNRKSNLKSAAERGSKNWIGYPSATNLDQTTQPVVKTNPVKSHENLNFRDDNMNFNGIALVNSDFQTSPVYSPRLKERENSLKKSIKFQFKDVKDKDPQEQKEGDLSVNQIDIEDQPGAGADSPNIISFEHLSPGHQDEILVPAEEYFALKKRLNKVQLKMDDAVDDAKDLIKAIETLQKDFDRPENKQRDQQLEYMKEATASNIPRSKSVVFFDHQNWNLVLNMMLGLQKAIKNVSESMGYELDKNDFNLRYYCQLVPKRVSGSESKYKICNFFDYAPKVFNEIRHLYGIKNEDYLQSIGPENMLNKWISGNLGGMTELISSGKSGSFFYYSADGKYTLKTVSKTEFLFLRQILKNYYDHLVSNSNTLIVKFFGCHKMKFEKGANHRMEKIYFLVMGNVFNTIKEVHVRYDLKGSTYGRTTKSADMSIARKDLDFLRNKEKLMFHPTQANLFVEQIEKDVKFFTQNNIIDYSVLIGIHYIHPERSAIGDPSALRRSKHAKNNQFNDWLKSYNATHRDGIISYDGEKIYFFGIIDVLTEFNSKKKFEFVVKSTLHGSGISAIPAQKYGERFVNFIKAAVQTPSSNIMN